MNLIYLIQLLTSIEEELEGHFTAAVLCWVVEREILACLAHVGPCEMLLED